MALHISKQSTNVICELIANDLIKIGSCEKHYAEAEAVEEPEPETDLLLMGLVNCLTNATKPSEKPLLMTGIISENRSAFLDSTDTSVFDVSLPLRVITEKFQSSLAQDPKYISFIIEEESEAEADPIVLLDLEKQTYDGLSEIILKADDMISEETTHKKALVDEILLQNCLKN